MTWNWRKVHAGHWRLSISHGGDYGMWRPADYGRLDVLGWVSSRTEKMSDAHSTLWGAASALLRAVGAL